MLGEQAYTPQEISAMGATASGIREVPAGDETQVSDAEDMQPRSRQARILLVKTSSLGDVVHMLPAVSDAARCCHGLGIDWVVEEGYSAIPSWHPHVQEVLPVALRRWRRNLARRSTWQEIRALRSQFRRQDYAAVIDSQGLYKSALLASWARGPRWGYDQKSAREPLVARVYQRTVAVPWDLHAIERNRRLLAAALNYRHEGLPLDYGLTAMRTRLPSDLPQPYVVGLHGTSRAQKEWPLSHWLQLGRWLDAQGVSLLLPWGSRAERKRAEHIASAASGVHVLPRLDLNALAAVLVHAASVVGVDTGLMHVAAALGCSGLAFYCATDPNRTGVTSGSVSAAIHNLVAAEALSWEAVERRLPALLEGDSWAAGRISHA
ncbi:MAG: lipopolysaccharide heptosyltransferase I [Gammaproteobacteria bacterium]